MIIKIDELLDAHNTSRAQLIEKNPDYESDFAKLDTYYQKYNENPSNVIGEKLNQTVNGYVAKLKKENPEIFEEKQPEKEVYEDKDAQLWKDFYTLIELGNTSDLDDLLGQQDEQTIKKLFTGQNYKGLHDAVNLRNHASALYILEQGERLGMLTDMVTARNGLVLTNIITMKDIPIIKVVSVQNRF